MRHRQGPDSEQSQEPKDVGIVPEVERHQLRAQGSQLLQFRQLGLLSLGQ